MTVTGAKGRTMRAAAVFAVAALSIAGIAPASAAGRGEDKHQSSQAQQTNPKPAATPAATEKVRINIELSGSRMPRKTCKTRAEWASEGVDLND